MYHTSVVAAHSGWDTCHQERCSPSAILYISQDSLKHCQQTSQHPHSPGSSYTSKVQPAKKVFCLNDYFFVEDMGCIPPSPSRQVGRAPMQGHPGVLRRRERNTLVPNSPKTGGCGEGKWHAHIHKEGLHSRPHLQ